jgi:4-O-beta-D-mannosyl-D-glucose phosphorylase
VLIYYGGSDTRCYVARTTVAKLIDWCLHTPEDALTTRRAVDQRLALIRANQALTR